MPMRSSVLVAEFEYLDADDLLALGAALLGEPVPLRDAGLLGAAAARPLTTIGGVDAYPDVWLKAAALLQSIVKNPPLIDGNKRLGWLATAVFLSLNDVDVTRATNDAVYEFVMAVASGNHDVPTLARQLERLTIG
jgi:death-on-curing protein